MRSARTVLEHCRRIAEVMPVVGFYLQPAVGGVILSADFWRRFASIDNVIAIKVAPFNRYGTLDVAFGIVQAGAEDLVHPVRHVQDHPPLLPQPADHVEQTLRLARGQTARRLVKRDHLRVARQRLGDLHHLPARQRQVLDQRVRMDVEIKTLRFMKQPQQPDRILRKTPREELQRDGIDVSKLAVQAANGPGPAQKGSEARSAGSRGTGAGEPGCGRFQPWTTIRSGTGWTYTSPRPDSSEL